MFATVQQACQDYYDQIPEHSLRSIGLSAMMSFTATLVILSYQTEINRPVSFSRPVLAAAVGVVASTVQAVTTPIFNYLFDTSSNQFNGFHECFKRIIVICLTQILFNRATSHNINLVNSGLYFQDANFVTFESNIAKVSFDIGIRICEFFGTPQGYRQYVEYLFGVNFNSNSNPIYIAF